mmetsp:Transcript_15839/g.32130  ORF Transcript_15839/g.32130 Transcript_15839/m.32130 type:complete len:225 (+) Transcript_15839:2505-3179(+)
MISVLEFCDDSLLLLRECTCEDDLLSGEDKVPLLVCQLVDFGSCHDDSGGVGVGLCEVGHDCLEVNDSDLLSDGLCSQRVVSCDHDDLDACVLALLHGLGHFLAGGVLQRQHSDELQSFKREVLLLDVEFESLGEVLGRQLELCKGEHTLSVGCQFHLCVCELPLLVLVERGSVDEARAPSDDLLGSALHQKKVSACGLFVDSCHELLGRVEGHASDLGVSLTG